MSQWRIFAGYQAISLASPVHLSCRRAFIPFPRFKRLPSAQQLLPSTLCNRGIPKNIKMIVWGLIRRMKKKNEDKKAADGPTAAYSRDHGARNQYAATRSEGADRRQYEK